jgi:hypothetical protein
MTASLRNAIDQDIFRIEDERYSDADFQAMSIDELERIKLMINKNIRRISTGIANKKTEDNGIVAESIGWYKRQRAALSINESVAAYVKTLITNRLRMSKTTGDQFMRRAKAVLSRELFERILNEAQMESANPGIN